MFETFFFYLFGAGSPLSIFVINLTISILFLISLFKVLTKKVKFEKTFFFFLIFILALIVSSLLAEDLNVSFKGLGDYWALFGGFIAGYFISTKTIKGLQKFETFFSISVSIAFLMGVIEFIFGTDFQRQKLFSSVNIGTMQAKGFFTHHLTYAGFLGIAFFYFFCLLLNGKRKWFYFLGAFASIFGIILSQSRGYLIITLLLIPFALVKKSLKSVIFVLSSLLIILAFLFLLFPNRIIERTINLFSMKNGSFAERVYLFRSGIEMAIKHPIFGYGPQGYQKYSEPFRKPYEKNIVYPHKTGFLTNCHTHNTYLMILIELGILGLVTFFLFLFSLFREIYSIKNEVKESFIFIFLFFLLGGFFEYNLGDAEVASLFSFMMGLSIALKRENDI